MNEQSFNNTIATDIYGASENLWDVEEYLLARHLKKIPSDLLILGCGGGRTVVPLIRAGHQVVALDISSAMVRATREKLETLKLKGDVRVGTATNLKDFRDDMFDCVFFPYNGIDYIESLGERQKCFKEVWRVLRQGGVFIYCSHNLFYYRKLIKYLLSSHKPYIEELFGFGKLMTYHCSPFSEGKNLASIFGNSDFFCTRLMEFDHSIFSSMMKPLLILLSRYPFFIAQKC